MSKVKRREWATENILESIDTVVGGLMKRLEFQGTTLPLFNQRILSSGRDL